MASWWRNRNRLNGGGFLILVAILLISFALLMWVTFSQ